MSLYLNLTSKVILGCVQMFFCRNLIPELLQALKIKHYLRMVIFINQE